MFSIREHPPFLGVSVWGILEAILSVKKFRTRPKPFISGVAIYIIAGNGFLSYNVAFRIN